MHEPAGLRREKHAAATRLIPREQRAGDMETQSVQVYSGVRAALEKLTSEAAVLAEHTKRAGAHDVTLEKLNTSFDQVQSRLVRVAAVKPEFSNILL